MNTSLGLRANALSAWRFDARRAPRSASLVLIACAHIAVLALLWQASKLPLRTALMPVLSVQLLSEPLAQAPALAAASKASPATKPQRLSETPTPPTSAWAIDAPSALSPPLAAVPTPAAAMPAQTNLPPQSASAAPTTPAEASTAPTAPPLLAAPRQVSLSAVRYLVQPPAEVPRASRRAGEHGTVWLRVVVNTAGLPRQVTLQRSSGFTRLDEQALWAMRQARFKPADEGGTPIEVEVIAPIDYPAD